MDREQIIRETFDLWATGDRNPDLSTVHPEIELNTASAQLRGEPYRGHEGVASWIADMEENFAEWELGLDHIEEVDERRMLALGWIHLKGRSSGVDIDSECGWVIDFEDGRSRRLDIYLSHAEARAAAGRP